MTETAHEAGVVDFADRVFVPLLRLVVVCVRHALGWAGAFQLLL